MACVAPHNNAMHSEIVLPTMQESENHVLRNEDNGAPTVVVVVVGRNPLVG